MVELKFFKGYGGRGAVLKNVSVILPISLNDKPREHAFRWVKKYYEKMLPEVEVCVGISNEKPFSKARVINKAVEKSEGEILVIADADIIFDPSILKQCIKQLETHSWVIPYQEVLNLSPKSTQDLIAIEPQWPLPIHIDTWSRPYGNQIKGGLNIVPRQHFETVGGFDERFVGWGGEDDAFAASLDYLCGSHKRMNFTLYHLWHEHNNEGNYRANVELLEPYHHGKESIMREIEKRRGKNS